MVRMFTHFLSILVCVSFLYPVVAAATTTTSTLSLEHAIAALAAESSRLQQIQLDRTATAQAHSFTHGFGFGATDAGTDGDVSMLQMVLGRDRTVYPEGIVSGYFGRATERALQAWQKKNNIVSSGTPFDTGYGRIGKRTRDALNAQLVREPIALPVLALSVYPNIVTQKPVLKTKVFTNVFSPLFFGSGSGTKMTFTQVGVPPGITVSSGLSCILPCKKTNTITISRLVAPGVYPISVTASVGKATSLGIYIIEISKSAAFEFGVVASGTINVQKSLTQSVVGTNDIIVTPISGDAKTVQLTQRTTAKGVTLDTPGFCSPPCVKHNHVSISPTATSGVYPVYVTASSGNATTSMSYNVVIRNSDDFGFHIERADAQTNELIIVRSAVSSSTLDVPLLFVLDGGRQTDTRVVLGALPKGISTSVTACMLPCASTLHITVGPTAATGTRAISFHVYADYLDRTAVVKKIVQKSFTQLIRIVTGG